MTHIKGVTIKPENLEKIKKVKEEHAKQDRMEMLFKEDTDVAQQVHVDANDQIQVSGGKVDVGPNLCSGSLDDAESGSLWDIFRQQDVPKLEEYLKRHFNEFRHIYGNLVPEVISKNQLLSSFSVIKFLGDSNQKFDNLIIYVGEIFNDRRRNRNKSQVH